MKCAILLGFAFCLFASTVARPVSYGSSRTLKGLDQRAVCSSKSGVKIVVTDGVCDAVAQSDCGVWVEAYNAFLRDSKKWEAEGICEKNKIEAAATAFAKTVARVHVSGGVQVECDGENSFACGYAFGDGSGQARAIAVAIAQAWADADPDKKSFDAFCDADVEAIAEIYSKVAEQVRIGICTGKGSAEVWQVKFEESIQCGIARALASAAAGFCRQKGGDYVKSFEKEFAWSKCTGTGEVIKFEGCGY